jgi:type IV secretory pathway component VirB8
MFDESDPPLLERPEEAIEIDKAMRAIAADEANRRRKARLLTFAPWGISVCCGLFAIGAGIIVARRPIPKPEVHVVFYSLDNPFFQAPVERDVLAVDRKRFMIKSDLQKFVRAWESYNWRGNQEYYDQVSIMTGGQPLQARYQDSWSNTKDPENRERKYGQNITRDVAAIQSDYVPGSPYALSFSVLIRTLTSAGSVCEWWAGNLTFKQDNNSIPLARQLAYDASDVVVITYFSTPADPAAKAKAC